jgi:2-methylisocitrate lyase-like PEP mutase family enzyme
LTRQDDRAARLVALHRVPALFVVPNAWDAGSARLLAGLGFSALATSSGASAAAYGRRDGQLSRDEALAVVRTVAAGTSLPVTADLENGFGDSPDDVAETIRLAAEAGASGGSIEDFSGSTDRPIYEIEHAVARVEAAVHAARSLPTPFVLTARSENFLHGQLDLDDTILRLRRFERAGADVLFAPGIPDLESVRAVCAAVSRPVNFMAGIRGRSFSLAALEEAGVRRVSLATSLYRAAMTALVEAAREVRHGGTFEYLDRTLTTAELIDLMAR